MASVVKYLTPADGCDDDPRFAGKIRTTSDGLISVYDAVSAVGVSEPRKYWERLKKDHEEVVTLCHNFKFPGPGQRDTPVTDRQGLTRILMLLPGKVAAKFREQVSILLERYLHADRTLAEDILRRADATDGAVVDVSDHPRVKSSWATKELGVAIKGYLDAHKDDKPGNVYPFVHDTNNLTVTGKTAAQLRAAYGVKGSSRDMNSKVQSAAMFFLQVSEADEIQRTGHNPCLVAKRNRELFEPVCKAKGLHDALADEACVRENAKVMRIAQKANREAAVCQRLCNHID